MLGDWQAAGGGDEAGRGRDVDQPRPVAAGAAAVGEQSVGPVERGRGGGERVGRADHLLRGLALHPKRDQHAANFAGLEFAEDEAFEEMLAVVAGEVLAREEFGQGVEGAVVRQLGGGGSGVISGDGVAEHFYSPLVGRRATKNPPKGRASKVVWFS